jgi:bifunctional DNA-binding transcriptional regulator/antitoxin component of YhaV-PrlF toxin-antitoxin module
MVRHVVTAGGQISLPADVRRRWGTKAVSLEDLGDHVVVRPLPDDPIAAARGALKATIPIEQARAIVREEEAIAEARRWRS